MAAYGSTSSDESNGAPTDFHISSSLESSNGRSSVSLERCPVCSHLNRTFFCHDCVRNGDFTSSRDKCPERFAEKKLPVSAVEELQREKQAVRSSVEALSGQLRVARKHVDRLRSDSQRKRQELAVCRRGAKEVVRASLNDLTRYIFPIKEHSPPPSEFGGGELGEEVFRHRVAQLNGNVVHLCASQGVDPSQLRPKATLRNLLLLLNPDMADLGRAEAFEMSPELSLSLEEGLSQDLALSTDSDSDDDCVGDEWESIASLPPPPSDLPSRGVHSTAMSHQQGPQQSPPAASLFSSAVALATNFWRPK
ncbi:conserved hypothetical protein [Ixodes scapularis]|uniref:Beclin 1-associated autophagy-related key regulator n=1 Tax=Ixodes scapularis TaxID=6945 RepID=B7P2K0_IXOSC|nr:conserved hypothetical protein [Ixodes scapularis]|eukprot:XP_002402460.1 conserved hypothetical protein [Ixodes scapularis]